MKKDYKAHFIIGGLIVAAFVLMWFGSRNTTSGTGKTVADPSVLSGIQTSTAPWSPELNHLNQRLGAIGLLALSMEGAALHIHQHLDIFINGRSIPVPASIGIT